METRAAELHGTIMTPIYLCLPARAGEALGTKMTVFEELLASDDIIENKWSYRFSGRTVRKFNSLKNNRLFDYKERAKSRKRGPQKMQVYLTMFMKTKGKKSDLGSCLTMFM